jgi:predicted flavoprotein YhiN
LRALGVPIHNFQPANCGWEVDWPNSVKSIAGQPLKNVRVTASGHSLLGELMITEYGLEGGAVYALGPILRTMSEPALTLDLKPAHTISRLVEKMESVRQNWASEAAVRWRLGPAARALLESRSWKCAEEIAQEAKSIRLELRGPRPLPEAISSAGGVCWSTLNEHLMVKSVPGLFVAGEMIDWEAPTGGYLLQGCFTTAAIAAEGMREWLSPNHPEHDDSSRRTIAQS